MFDFFDFHQLRKLRRARSSGCAGKRAQRRGEATDWETALGRRSGVPMSAVDVARIGTVELLRSGGRPNLTRRDVDHPADRGGPLYQGGRT